MAEATDTRARILRAARKLVRRRAADGLSMRDLAREADVSVVTLYNQFGSKAGVLTCLVDRWLFDLEERMREAAGTAGLERVLAIGRIGAEMIAADPGLYRPLLRELTEAGNLMEASSIVRHCLAIWGHAIEDAARSGAVRPGVDHGRVALQLYVSFTGHVELWIHGEIDDDAFRAHVTYSTALMALAVAERREHERFAAIVAALERELPAELRGARAARTGTGRNAKRRSRPAERAARAAGRRRGERGERR